MNTLIFEGSKAINSDLHFGHKNVWLFEFDNRKPFLPSGYDSISKDELSSFLKSDDKAAIRDFIIKADANMARAISEQIRSHHHIIKEYLCLGDVFFEPKGRFDKLDHNEGVRIYGETMDFLKMKGIRTGVVRGNHDSGGDELFASFFQDIHDFIQEGNTVFTHEPIGMDYGGIWRFPKNLFQANVKHDKNSIMTACMKSGITRNFHGHTHGKSVKKEESVPGIEYTNCSIEACLNR